MKQKKMAFQTDIEAFYETAFLKEEIHVFELTSEYTS